MKTLIAAVAALALLASPAFAGKLVTEDNPDVPNCVLGADNAPDCENVLGKPIYLTGFTSQAGETSYR